MHTAYIYCHIYHAYRTRMWRARKMARKGVREEGGGEREREGERARGSERGRRGEREREREGKGEREREEERGREREGEGGREDRRRELADGRRPPPTGRGKV